MRAVFGGWPTESSLVDDNDQSFGRRVLKSSRGSCFRRVFAVRGVGDTTDKWLDPMPAARISVPSI